MAREGNTTALNIAASRLWRESKPTFDVFELPESDSPEETVQNIINAMTAGNVSPDWAASAMATLRAGSELTDIQKIKAMLEQMES